MEIPALMRVLMTKIEPLKPVAEESARKVIVQRRYKADVRSRGGLERLKLATQSLHFYLKLFRLSCPFLCLALITKQWACLFDLAAFAPCL